MGSCAGRGLRNRDAGKTLLTPQQQEEARRRVETGEPQRNPARSSDVSQATISRRAL